jgi:signal transduction histidine kinase
MNKSLAIAKEMGLKESVIDSYNQLADCYYENKDYKNAYDYLSLYQLSNDSLRNKEITDKSAELEAKYNNEKKENEIAILNKDKEVKDAELKKQKQLKNSFITGIVLLIILSIFILNNFRVRNKLRLQNIRNKIASDLHDDIGSTLNSISVYSEVAKQKSPSVVQELEQIGEASRKIIDAMSDIVWMISSKNDSFENIILRMRSLGYNLLKAKNIEHTFRVDEDMGSMKLSMEERRNFFLIFKEAVNNLVKYSDATRASINLSHEKELIKLSVRDNGKGFDVKQFSTGNGLFNMRSRAQEMNAELKIESEPGKGTTIELTLKS